MSYDLILEEIGEFGKWQKLVFLLAGLCGGGGAFVHYTWTFVGFMPEDYRCVWRKMFLVTPMLIGNYVYEVLTTNLLQFSCQLKMFLDYRYTTSSRGGQRLNGHHPTSPAIRKTSLCH